MSGRILIVDDEKDMLTLLRRIISEETRYELVTETDPFRAIDKKDIPQGFRYHHDRLCYH